jgi:hypothetical protein
VRSSFIRLPILDLNPITIAFFKPKALLWKAAERTIPGLFCNIWRITKALVPQSAGISCANRLGSNMTGIRSKWAFPSVVVGTLVIYISGLFASLYERQYRFTQSNG